jgi:taurine dioxygenase
MNLGITQLSPVIGAEINGVDITKPLDNDAFAAVHQALLDHIILVFRDQPLDDDALMALGRRFSTLVIHPFIMPNTDRPEIVAIMRDPGDISQRRRWAPSCTPSTFRQKAATQCSPINTPLMKPCPTA